jgi:serine phosphatase RsbU (regulator of sigma subunit)
MRPADASAQLGVRTVLARTHHEIDLDPGDTLVLYTDGLVERRDEHLSTGFAALSHGQARGVAELGDHVLSTLAPSTADDVALVVVRVLGPDQQPGS